MIDWFDSHFWWLYFTLNLCCQCRSSLDLMWDIASVEKSVPWGRFKRSFRVFQEFIKKFKLFLRVFYGSLRDPGAGFSGPPEIPTSKMGFQLSLMEIHDTLKRFQHPNCSEIVLFVSWRDPWGMSPQWGSGSTPKRFLSSLRGFQLSLMRTLKRKLDHLWTLNPLS